MRSQRFWRALEEKKKLDPIEQLRTNWARCKACEDAGWAGKEVTYKDPNTGNSITCDGADVDYLGMEHATRNSVEVRAKHRAPHHVGSKEDVVRVHVDWDLQHERIAIPVRSLVFFPVDLAARHEHIPFVAGTTKKTE